MTQCKKQGVKKSKKLKKLTKKYYDKRIKSLHKKCWKLMSLYIRKRDKNTCFTCGKKTGIMNAGHFRHGALDYDEKNINCQCVYCNKYLHGNLGIYGINLVKKIGVENVDDLIKRSRILKKYSEEELLKIKTKLEKKLNES